MKSPELGPVCIAALLNLFAVPHGVGAGLAVAMSLYVTQVHANEGNLVRNGSFEAGVYPPDNPGYLTLNSGSTAIDRWTVIRGGIDYYGAGWVASNGHRSLDLNGTPGVGGVAQTFATTPGQRYRVIFDMAGHNSGLLQTMRVRAAGQYHDFKFQSRGDPQNLGWETREWQFTANAFETTLEFYSVQTEYAFGGPALDNVYVAQVGGEADGVRVLRRPEGKTANLIVLVHGCCTESLKEWDELGEAIISNIKYNKQWELVVYDWTKSTPPPPERPLILQYAGIAYEAASNWGTFLANDIIRAGHPYDYIHFIGHSAGAKVIQEAATALVSRRVQERGTPFIHLTFLDAYTKEASDSGVKGFGDLGGYKRYFAEHYVDVGLVGTDEMLKQAVNFDVTSWVGKRRGHLNIIDEIWYGHHWPLYWYESSITDPRAIYGYKLSREAGNERFERLRRMYCPGTSCPVNGSCLALSGCPKPDRK